MSKRFVLLRGTPGGAAFLARPEHPDDADTWTSDRDKAWRFADRLHADTVRETIVGRSDVAVAVVPVEVV